MNTSRGPSAAVGFLLTSAALLAAAGPSVQAADHFLTIGGGNSAANNQVSLEKNILYLQRYLADCGLGDVPNDILFSDGTAGARDLQFVDPKANVPRVNELLAEIFHQEHGLELKYRPHAIPHLSGSSDRQSIGRWFDTVGARLNDGDRLIIYYTGHGGRGRPARNTTLALWNEPDMPVKEFVKLLDKLPPKVSVVLVMVQCFSGGFADVIYNDADQAHGLSPRNRCGFFATVADRMAAGCTADVDEENYREYSTYFWAALYGRTRGGERVPPPDDDGDGHISLAEAHGYTVVNSDTIDVPNKTSDAFLRQFSRLRTSPPNDAGSPALLGSEDAFEDLLKAAEPPERAALTGLSDRLKLSGPDRVRSVRRRADEIQQQRRSLERERQQVKESHDRTCGRLQYLLRSRWPELSNLLNPAATLLLTTDADHVVKLVESSPDYAELRKLDDRAATIDDKLDDLERRWVKDRRFVLTAEHVAMAANLPAVAKPEIVERYRLLAAAENGTLGGTRR